MDWHTITQDTKQLSKKLQRLKLNRIIAVSRGGLVPAGVLSHHLNIKHIETVCVSSYDGQAQGSLMLLNTPPADGEDVLIVDDLVDSGATFSFLRKKFPKAIFCCVYAKPAGIPSTDYYGMVVPQDTWLDFPWEITI